MLEGVSCGAYQRHRMQRLSVPLGWGALAEVCTKGWGDFSFKFSKFFLNYYFWVVGLGFRIYSIRLQLGSVQSGMRAPSQQVRGF